MLKIENLHASIGDKEILKGINLTVGKGEVHAIMGPNGSGKSTLSSVLVGHPTYEVTEGSVTFEGEDILELEPEERAHRGLFLSFQYPVEIPGVSMVNFMRAALNERRKAAGLDPLPAAEFLKLMKQKRELVELDNKLASRSVNEGFSGGEKKRNEIVQMEMLRPSLAMLDEIDSGLDVDAMHIVANAINNLRAETGMSLMIVSHYDRFFELIEPQYTHVLVDGKVVLEGDGQLARKIDTDGYDWIYAEYGIEAPREKKAAHRPASTIGSCAVRNAAEAEAKK